MQNIRKKTNRKRWTKKKVIHSILYVITAILVLASIPMTASAVSTYYNTKHRSNGYAVYDLYVDFTEQDYHYLFQKVAYNRGLDIKVTEDMKDYYTFTDCYNAAVDYQMYVKTGNINEANAALEKFRGYENQLVHRIFKDALMRVKETYGIDAV